MADPYFDFESDLNNGVSDSFLPPEDGEQFLPADDEDDRLENEEEYDALNDETFGASSNFDDWEQQHEQFAEFEEHSKHSEQLENSLSQLVLDKPDPLLSSVWSYTPTPKNGDIFGDSKILSSLELASKSFIESHTDSSHANITNSLNSTPLPIRSTSPVPRKITTVEELEKNLIKTSKNVQSPPQPQPIQQSPLSRPILPPPGHSFHPLLPHPGHNARLPPPGMSPMGIPPPGLPHLPPHQMNHHRPILPPGLMRMMPPQFMHGNGPPRPPGFMFPPGNNQIPVNHPFNFPPPPRPNMNNMAHNNQMNRNNHHQQQQHQQQQQQRNRHDSGNYRSKDLNNSTDSNKDEYAGLMTMKEKQWLLNIQMLQLNTGTPYFDDYYYTVFKERKTKNRENFINERNVRYPNNRQNRNNDRQENNTLTPRVYTPLQFENSLGKLQCGSVTAPRKIIDMDIVTPDKDSDIGTPSRDSRKIKQLLLELESLYGLLLKAEDLKNPLAISNMEKLREIKQKQRLRELELAPTPEQKQEVLKLFKQESEPVVENQYDYIIKIVSGLLQEDKFCSFLNIRKGKMLLLRLLPHLSIDNFSQQLLEIWTKVLLCLPIIGRRDMAGDNILPKLQPFLKRYVQITIMTDILEIVNGLVEVVRPDNNRSTPLSHQGKAPLYFVLLNRFGVSALVILFIRTEYLISVDKVTEKQQNDWSNFLISWAELTGVVSKVASPIELIPLPIFNKHCNRFGNLTHEKRNLLEKHFVDSI